MRISDFNGFPILRFANLLMIALSGQACVFEVSSELSAEAIDRVISVKEALLRVIKRQTVLVLTDHSPERILCLCFILVPFNSRAAPG